MSVVRQLYQLQLVDSEHEDKSNRLAEVEASLGETGDLIRAREAIVEAEGASKELRSRLRALELDVAALNDKLKRNQERLYSGRVRNPKELSGLQGEAAALRRRISELEDRELELMIAVEEGEAELAERQARLRQIEANWRKDQAALQTEKEQLAQRLAELEEEQAGMRARIGAADGSTARPGGQARGLAGVLAEYDDLRARFGGVAVARLKGGICQACGVDVPTGVARAVERGEGMHYCPVCNRLLCGG